MVNNGELKLPRFRKSPSPKLYWISLAAIFAAVWIWAAINPLFRHDWLLENYLVFFGVPLILLSGFYFQLSRISYGLITVFMCLHVIGSRYTYAEVPFGYTLQRWLGADRNMYDRLVHFCFGFLLAYPIRELFLRVAKVRGFWGFFLPLDVTLAFSAIYEIIEWLAAANVDPAAGLAFLGSQGDVWDTQKDMTCAGVGALLSMLVIAAINWKFNPDFWHELKQSLKLRRDDKPLGEEKIREWMEH